MESGAGDGGRPVVVEETGVRLEGRKVGAVNVEGLDFVAVGTPGLKLIAILKNTDIICGRRPIHAEDRSVLVYAQCPEGILCGVDGR